MIEETYEGVPGNKIPWAPKIDYDKCITCGKCVDYCQNSVFAFEEKEGKRRTVVKNPDSCVVFCWGCEAVCPADAITHPSEEKTEKIIEKLKKLQSDNVMLDACHFDFLRVCFIFKKR
ncbi:MAG: ferredoxin family protein [Candidatus Bathyarchaeota archaeon]|nr:ferredoxin family protein [Candidatus Bathyarchaeota archaeon]